MQKRLASYVELGIALLLLFTSCSKVAGPAALFKKLTPHDAYGQHLKDAGLEHTAMGNSWLQTADASIGKALTVTLPYKETGYFAADKTPTASFKFEARRGEYIHILLSKKPLLNFRIYIDLFRQESGASPQLVASADTAGTKLDYEIKQTGQYLLRLQPELLSGGEYTLTIITGPSLGFPVAPSGRPHIGSFYGDSRDEGGRKHEGIDIFAPKGTPALAAADGIATKSENKLGGLVVFLRPDGRDYTLYYAHLGVQLIHDGQTVHAGDTVGLIDNTGNAKNTPSHLHFGIYTSGGAVDPMPFVNREIKEPHKINAPFDLLNTWARTSVSSRLYLSPDKKAVPLTDLPLHTVLLVNAAADDLYKVTLPDGRCGYISSSAVSKLNDLKIATIKIGQPLYDAPDSLSAASKMTISAGNKVNILGVYKNYYLVSTNGETGWIK